MGSKFEKHFFKFLSSATLNLILTLLFLSLSYALNDCCILGNQIPKDSVYTHLSIFCSPQPTADFTGTVSVPKLPSNDLQVSVPALVCCCCPCLFPTFYRLYLQQGVAIKEEEKEREKGERDRIFKKLKN